MSSGAECNFTEREPGVWWYRLQQWPYGDTYDFDEYGPFDTYKEASEHLHANHSNPGGHSTERHPDHVHEYADVPYKTFGVSGYLAGETWTQYECVGCGRETPEAREAEEAKRLDDDIEWAEKRLATLKAEKAERT